MQDFDFVVFLACCPNVESIVDKQNVEGNTCLHLAALRNKCTIALLLVKMCKANVNVLNNARKFAFELVPESSQHCNLDWSFLKQTIEKPPVEEKKKTSGKKRKVEDEEAEKRQKKQRYLTVCRDHHHHFQQCNGLYVEPCKCSNFV